MRLRIATISATALLLLGASAYGEQRPASRLIVEMADGAEMTVPATVGAGETANATARSLAAPTAAAQGLTTAMAIASASATAAVASSAPAAPAAPAASAAPAAPAAHAHTNGLAVLLSGLADQLRGVRYRFGGNTESGLDCSGLVRLVWQRLGLGALPRTAANMANLGLPVALRDIEPGDLVFFNTLGRSFSHVGVYLGEGRFLHASSGQRQVTLSSLSERYFRERFEGARRLLQ